MIEEENKRLSSKDALAEVSRKLKKVLNPTFLSSDSSGSGLYFKLVTDITTSDEPIYLKVVVNGTGEENESSAIISFQGYIVTNPSDSNIKGINFGTCKVNLFGYKFIKDLEDIWKLNLIIGVPFADTLSTEIFYSNNPSDNKNHCTEIVYATTEDFDPENIEQSIEDWHGVTTFPGESEINFSFKVREKDYQGFELWTTVDKNSLETTTQIDEIYSAQLADQLSDPITIQITGDVTGEGSFLNAGDTVELDVELSDDKKEEIADEILSQLTINPATHNNLGGFRIANRSDLSQNEYPIELKHELNADDYYAYVDLSNFRSGESDKHRYSDMELASNEKYIGDIVEYIGENTNDYTKGYFYIRVGAGINVTFPLDTNWTTSESTWQDIINSKITQYNIENDYQLSFTNGINLAINPDTIDDNQVVDTTEFIITSGTFSDVLPYSTIKEWGIELYNQVITYTETPEDYNLSLGIAWNTTQSMWKQKNVLPPISMSSALIYKGSCTWEQLQSYTSSAAPGDFYTITDRSYQEYFFTDNGTWEYMGEVFESNYVSQEAPGTLSVQVGGIANNTPVEDITNRSVSEVLDMILFPDIEPTLSGSQNFTFNTSQAKTVAYGSDAYATSVFSTSHSEQTVSYSKQNNAGSVLKNQTYQGAFTTSEITKSPNINKFTSNVTYSCTGTWANGDKYPCTKKGNTPVSGSPSGAYVSQSSTKTVTINVLKHCLYGVADTINATSIAQGTKLFRTSTGSFDITLDHPVGGRHFIAVPAVSGQNWTIGDIKLGVLDVTNSFTKETVQNVTVTNNGETYTTDMYVAYLTNPAAAADSVTYNITIS